MAAFIWDGVWVDLDDDFKVDIDSSDEESELVKPSSLSASSWVSSKQIRADLPKDDSRTGYEGFWIFLKSETNWDIKKW